MANEDGEKRDEQLELGESRPVVSLPEASGIQKWQYDLVNRAIVNAGTVVIIAGAAFLVDWILAFLGMESYLPAVIAKWVFTVGFIVLLVIAVVVDVLVAARNQWRLLRSNDE